MNIPQTIQAAIKCHGLIPANTKVVVGLSGGADSVALAWAFKRLDIPFTAAHLNHKLRGGASDADEAFVRSLGFPTMVKSVDIKALAAQNSESIEMAARRARHEFFAEFDDAVIALAHHADDQVETFFLKLVHGAGTEGLCGMQPLQQIGPLRLIRPMLSIRRPEILTWLKENGFTWREDASNSNENFRRNKIRHSIIPLLEQELNPGIHDAVLRTMNILNEENRWMTGMQETSDSLAARRRRLRQWLFGHGAGVVSLETVDRMLDLMASGTGSAICELNGRQRVIVEYGLPRMETDEDKKPVSWNLVTEHGTGWRKDHGKGAGILPAEASFDATAVGSSSITVRRWREGDRMAPLGMDGTRKLQDIFTDQKIPRARRDSIPVVVCRDEIIWLPGYRIARGWEVKSPTEKSIHLLVT